MIASERFVSQNHVMTFFPARFYQRLAAHSRAVQVHRDQQWHFSSPAAEVEALVILHKRFPQAQERMHRECPKPTAELIMQQSSLRTTNSGESSSPLLTTLPLGDVQLRRLSLPLTTSLLTSSVTDLWSEAGTYTERCSGLSDVTNESHGGAGKGISCMRDTVEDNPSREALCSGTSEGLLQIVRAREKETKIYRKHLTAALLTSPLMPSSPARVH